MAGEQCPCGRGEYRQNCRTCLRSDLAAAEQDLGLARIALEQKAARLVAAEAVLLKERELTEDVSALHRTAQTERDAALSRAATAEAERDALARSCGEVVERAAIAEGRVERLEGLLTAARSVLWMAEAYAEGGGRSGPEQRDVDAVNDALAEFDAALEGR